MHTWSGYVYDVQLGISQYLAQRPEWICTRMLPIPQTIQELGRMEFDGAIAFVEADYARALGRLNVPVVDISNWLPKQHFPRVLADDLAIGRVAARYLLDLGLHHFAVIGLNGLPFCDLRREGFRQTLAKDGFAVHELPDPCQLTLPEGVELPPRIGRSFAAWLLQLPKPIGVFATFGHSASDAIETCRRLGIKVPEEVCILASDIDELTARFAHPPLSSIALPSDKIGFEAARLLDQLMAGQKPPAKPICLAPIGVVTRQSTNLLAIADPDVLAAVRYMREHIHEGVTVDDVLRVVPTNRRYLERRFQEHLGCSPLQEIRRIRIAKARELLSGTDLSMPEIAKRSGFISGDRLAKVFHEDVGMTPTQYRRQLRLND